MSGGNGMLLVLSSKAVMADGVDFFEVWRVGWGGMGTVSF